MEGRWRGKFIEGGEIFWAVTDGVTPPERSDKTKMQNETFLDRTSVETYFSGLCILEIRVLFFFSFRVRKGKGRTRDRIAKKEKGKEEKSSLKYFFFKCIEMNKRTVKMNH